MRQIKFRCWNKLYKQMQNWEHLIGYCDVEYLFGKEKAFEGHDVVPMQYTGLKDIDGAEIYEGDIIECWGRNLSIKWEDSDASFFAESIDGNIYESGQEWGGNCRVVGNIYQNKELLDEY